MPDRRLRLSARGMPCRRGIPRALSRKRRTRRGENRVSAPRTFHVLLQDGRRRGGGVPRRLGRPLVLARLVAFGRLPFRGGSRRRQVEDGAALRDLVGAAFLVAQAEQHGGDLVLVVARLD